MQAASEYDHDDGYRRDDAAYREARDLEIAENLLSGNFNRLWSKDEDYTPAENAARQAHLESTTYWVVRISVSGCAQPGLREYLYWNERMQKWVEKPEAQRFSYQETKALSEGASISSAYLIDTSFKS